MKVYVNDCNLEFAKDGKAFCCSLFKDGRRHAVKIKRKDIFAVERHGLIGVKFGSKVVVLNEYK